MSTGYYMPVQRRRCEPIDIKITTERSLEFECCIRAGMMSAAGKELPGFGMNDGHNITSLIFTAPKNNSNLLMMINLICLEFIRKPKHNNLTNQKTGVISLPNRGLLHKQIRTSSTKIFIKN